MKLFKQIAVAACLVAGMGAAQAGHNVYSYGIVTFDQGANTGTITGFDYDGKVSFDFKTGSTFNYFEFLVNNVTGGNIFSVQLDSTSLTFNTGVWSYTSPTALWAGDHSLTIGFHDTGAPGGDFGGTFKALTVSAVPEPETYAMMLAGLGAVGFMARRRKMK